MINIITTQSQLHHFLEIIKNDDIWAVDTEFIRDKTYFAQLCLIQIATDSSAAVIDVLALIDLHPFYTLLYRENITKVFHAGRQDCEIFFSI